MKQKNGSIITGLAVLGLFILIAGTGCDLLTIPKAAGMLIKLDYEADAKSIRPNISLAVTSYDITAEGPGDASFKVEGITDQTYSKTDLAAGEWVVQAIGKNADGTIIVQSPEVTVILVANEQKSVDVHCVPMLGDGNFKLTVTWPAGIITTPVVEASLTPETGSDIILVPVLSGAGNSITIEKEDLPNGYYTLSFALKYGEKDNYLAFAWNESVLIYNGKLSEANWTIEEADIDQPESTSMLVKLTSDSKAPIKVNFTGNNNFLATGSTMTVNATTWVSPPLTWQWYFDGKPISGATDPSITIGEGLNGGTVHSLVAIAKKGDKAGSAGFRFRVITPKIVSTTDVPDPALREAMEESTGKAFGTITTTDLLGVSTITKDNSELADLTGIGLCENLTQLHIANNASLTSIPELTDLKKLQGLQISHCPIADFSPIASLTSLRMVKVSPVDMSDLDFMTKTNLPNLRSIGILNHYGMVYSKALAEKLAQFPLLNFTFGMNITDAEFNELYTTALLPNCETLESYEDFKGSQLTDAVTGSFSNLNNVVLLHLWNAPALESLEFLETMTALIEVGFDGDTGITDLSPLESLYNNGGLRSNSYYESWLTPYVVITNMELDLKPGSPNRAVVDFLLSHDVGVEWEEGNIIE